MKMQINGRTLWVNYHHLYCFYVIATQGSLTGAAKTLGIGQSALSIQMRQLEEQLGVPLFDRSHRKVEPNEQGRLIYSYTKEIFRLGVEMVEGLHDRPTSKLIHLQIGALDTIPKHLMIDLVCQARELKPCTVSVVEGKPEALLKSLMDHQIDLAVFNSLPRDYPGKITARKIAKTPVWAVGGKRFLRLKKGFPASLKDQPFIVPTVDSHLRLEFENYCRIRSLEVDIQIETQDLMVQKLLALRQIGLSVMPEFAVREYIQKKELFLIGQLEDVHEELFLVSAARKIENPVASLLLKHFAIQ